MLGKEYKFKIAKIKKIRKETENIRTYYLKIEDQKKEEYKPGRFSVLYIYGGGEVPISISGIEDDTITYTVRFAGSVTNMFNNLKIDDKIGIRGPYGNHWPLEENKGKDIVIVSGGIGLAPLRPIIYEVKKNRNDYGKLFILYGARTPNDLIFKTEFKEYEEIKNCELHVTVDKGDEKWKGNVGVVTTLIPKINVNPENTVAFICGPEIMMKFTVKDLMNKSKLPKTRIYVSMERRMRCGIGLCGHCQIGPYFVCKDGPVFPFYRIEEYFGVRWI